MIARNGSVRVLDFGLARADASAADALATSPSSALVASLTKSAGLIGTPAYMAPEQLACEPTDVRADQFSFCVALFQSLTGARPFVGATPRDLLTAIREGRRDTARESQIPPWMRPIIARGLRSNPGERFASMSELLAALERDPAAARRRWLIATVGLSAFAAITAVGYQQARRHASRVCQLAEAPFAGVWDAARKARVQAAFIATGAPYARDVFASTARVLDTYVQQWSSMHVDACLATRVRGEQSEELLDLRMSCLEQRRDELKSLTDLFARADVATVEKSPNAAYSLSDVEQCANIAALKAPTPPPHDPALRTKIEALRKRLAEATAAFDAGKLEEPLQGAASIVNEARALNYAPLAAEALLLEGKVHQRRIDGAKSEHALHQALVAAAEGHHARVAAYAYGLLTYAVGNLLNRHDEGRFWGDLALASFRQLGGNSDRDIAITLGNISGIALEEGKLDEALTLADREGELLGKSAPQTLAMAMNLHNKAVILANLGRNEEALAAARRSLEISEQVVGPNHPSMEMMFKMTGLALVELNRDQEALVYLRRAVALSEQVFGPLHFRTALAYSTLSSAYEGLGDYEQALATSRRSIEIYDQIGSKNRLVMVPHLTIGRIELKRGRPAAAIAELERSLSIEQSAKAGPASDLAEVKFVLAQALWQAHGDRPRALTLAREARSGYASEPRLQASLAEVDTWLAARGR
jgi:tetratricopeptide (TPR) repeat protein